MTKKEYEEKKATIEKEIDKYCKRTFWGFLGMGGSGAASVYIFNTIPLKALGFSSTMGLICYSLFGPLRKRESARYDLQQLKEQRLSELEQRVGEEFVSKEIP